MTAVSSQPRNLDRFSADDIAALAMTYSSDAVRQTSTAGKVLQERNRFTFPAARVTDQRVEGRIGNIESAAGRECSAVCKLSFQQGEMPPQRTLPSFRCRS
jgi:hypothetical protein